MQKIRQLSVCFWKIASRFYEGIRLGRGKKYVAIFSRLLGIHARQLVAAFYQQTDAFGDLESVPLQRLKSLSKGLHSLLPPDPRFTFSILLPVSHPDSHLFRKALKSALDQTSGHLEILVGFIEQPSSEIQSWIHELQTQHPQRLSIFHWEEKSDPNSTLKMLNHLAEKASGHFLLLMRDEDWLRPDLTFRYEQTLRLAQHPEKTVLCCREWDMDRDDHLSLPSEEARLDSFIFPYCFTNPFGHSALIPKTLWKKAAGLSLTHAQDPFYALALRLDLAGAHFVSIPLPLYASRQGKSSSQKEDIQALKEYVKAKNLDWEVTAGMRSGFYRAIPKLSHTPRIQVIIPFKEQKELTLKAVQSVLKQEGVQAIITAVDNNSRDLSITQTLAEWGVEVLHIDEPFNFSRLNNLAARQTTAAAQCELILFLNNDVELEKGALLEMSRWLDQPSIGMVGCRLHYPTGPLQHGGIIRSRFGPREEMIWQHAEIGKPKEALVRSAMIHVADAVTAACAMIKRSTFNEVGGFDEIWYPVAYSDTNLAVKLKEKGLWCLYTPYAEGIHHESQTRHYNHIEDYEKSSWLDAYRNLSNN